MFRRWWYRRTQGECLPWEHEWTVTRVSVPAFDLSAKGILKRCRLCPKVVAK